MSYRSIDEISIGEIVWVMFLPDADGIADDDTTAMVLDKNFSVVRIGIEGPDGAIEESAYELRENRCERDIWTAVESDANIRLAPASERTSGHNHCCRKCGWKETHVVPPGCREPYFWLCYDCEELPDPSISSLPFALSDR